MTYQFFDSHSTTVYVCEALSFMWGEQRNPVTVRSYVSLSSSSWTKLVLKNPVKCLAKWHLNLARVKL